MADSYPLPVFHFSVDLGGNTVPFSEVSGLNIENQVIEYRDGQDPEYSVRKMPGIPKFGNITLKRGILRTDNQLFEWFSKTKMNIPDRRDITISLLNEDHKPAMVWKVKNAFPVKLESPGLKASGNEVAIESIEIAHEGLTVEIVA